MNNILSKEYRLNLHLLLKRCGLARKDISALIGESRQTVWHDFKGGNVSQYRMMCYEKLPEFLEYAISNGVVFKKLDKETSYAESYRRRKLVEILKDKFLGSLAEDVCDTT